jgi:hypothetical protein
MLVQILSLLTLAPGGSALQGSSISPPPTCKKIAERFAVLTGVEVTPPQVHGSSRDDGGEAKLQMIRHKSRLLPSGTFIDAVF